MIHNIVKIKIEGVPSGGKSIISNIIKEALEKANENGVLGCFDAVSLYDESGGHSSFNFVNKEFPTLHRGVAKKIDFYGCMTEEYINDILNSRGKIMNQPTNEKEREREIAKKAFIHGWEISDEGHNSEHGVSDDEFNFILNKYLDGELS